MGFIFLIFGPSGSGKTTLLEAITKRDDVSRIITATDRTPRTSEVNKKDYYFFTPEQFTEKIKKKQFLEYSMYPTGNRYGILHSEVKKAVTKGKDLVAVLDFAGVSKIKNLYNDRAISIFVYRGADAIWEEINNRPISDIEKRQRMEKARSDFLVLDRADYVICNMSGIEDMIIDSEKIIRDARMRNPLKGDKFK